ncbi:hypothetical protein [Paenibacillus macerans]|uniref:hypothetical protein n=1 Tax=Paenibacillus macerans TaxID=44252 RepID=UPI003D321E40
MKKRYKYITLGIILIILVGVAAFFYQNSKHTTFNKVVLNKFNVEEISSLNIISRLYDSVDEDEISLSDQNQINKIVDYFSHLDLKESNLSNISYTESYWITIRVNEKLAFGLTLYGNSYISIFDYNRNITSSYQITNKVDPPVVIRELFKK